MCFTCGFGEKDGHNDLPAVGLPAAEGELESLYIGPSLQIEGPLGRQQQVNARTQ
jgi:hypothetical protein